MLLRCILIALFLWPRSVSADQDFVSYLITRNVFFANYNSRHQNDPKAQLLYEALTEISEKYFSDTACVTVRFGLDSFVVNQDIFHGRAPFYLGYSSRQFRITSSKRINEDTWGKTRYRQSVNVYITEPNFSVREVLELVFYAWGHSAYTQAIQTPVFIKASIMGCCQEYVPAGLISGVVIKNFEFTPVLSRKKVNEILFGTYPPVEEILQKRFDGYNYEVEKSIIHSYLQNDSFFYYIVDSSKGHKEKIILRSNGEGRIESDGSNNDLIILSQTAWHYTRNNQKLTGPIKMPDISYLKNLEEPHLASSLHSRSDSELVITKKLIFDQYTMVYNTRQQTIYLDTPNFSENLKWWLKREEEEKQRTHFTNEYPWQKTYRKTIADHTRTAVLAFAAICILAGIYIGIKNINSYHCHKWFTLVLPAPPNWRKCFTLVTTQSASLFDLRKIPPLFVFFTNMLARVCRHLYNPHWCKHFTLVITQQASIFDL